MSDRIFTSTIQWKPIEFAPRSGKFLVINKRPYGMEIATATLTEKMDAVTRAAYLKLAIAYADFPDVQVLSPPGMAA